MSGQNILIYREPSPDTIVPQIIGNTFVKLDKLTNELVKQSDDIKVLTAGPQLKSQDKCR